MLHKYVFLRGNNYIFRWRIPADLRVVFGARELKRSLHTTDHLQAIIRAGRLIEIVTEIKNLKYGYKTRVISEQYYLDMLRDCWSRTHTKTISSSKTTNLVDTIDAPEQLESDCGLLFSELFEAFIAYKTDAEIAKIEARKVLRDKAQKEYRRYFTTLIEILSDLPIAQIDRSKVKDMLRTYKQLPQRNKLPYKGLPVAELLEMEIPEEDQVSNKTVEAVRKLLQGIFRYAIDSGYIEQSPARDLNLKLDVSNTFAPYNKKEVTLMLSEIKNEKKSWQQWLPLLAAYTGARRAELVQLRKQDIKFDHDSNRHYILITDLAGSVKTENSIRQVPIHPRILDAGFLEFVEASNDRLFSNIKPQAVTGWFARFRARLGIEPFDDFGNKKVFHSFRHTFITLSRAAGNSLECVQQVVGHEKTRAGITDRYSHRLPITDVLSVVDKVSYEL